MKMERTNKMKVSAVSYLNTKPFIFGLEQDEIINNVDLFQDIPVVVANKLIHGTAAIGLVPTAVIPQIPSAKIITDYCIGSDGPVTSVCIYSQVKIEEIEAIYLDYQSRTSVELTRILLKDYWKIKPQLLKAVHGYENKISDTTAGLIIGDRSLQLKSKFKYCYDLGEAWKDLTALPFVYACWVTTEPLSNSFVESFNNAIKKGIESIPQVAKQNEFFYPGVDTYDYLMNKIKYPFTDLMRKGMETFLEQHKGDETIMGNGSVFNVVESSLNK
jgi:chorismate dehydratase